MYRKLRVLFLLGMMLLAGCTDSGGTNGEDSAADQVTIRFLHLWPEAISAGQYRVVGQIAREYEELYPHVSILTEDLENEQYKNKLRILSATNELPDVGLTWAAGFLSPYVEGKLFTPLDDLLDSGFADAFIPGTTEAFAIDGHTYALPLEFNVAPIFYNKEIFRQFRLEIPQTLDELKHVIAVLAEQNFTPIALGNKDRWTGSLWYMYLADRYAGQQALADALEGRTSFLSKELLKAAEEVQALVDSHAFVRGFNGLSNEEARAEFLSGRAAMYFIGSWVVPDFTTNADIPLEFRSNVGFFKFPTSSDGRGHIDDWIGGPGVGLFVAENSPVKEEAKRFVQYFVERWGELSVTEAGVIPATKVDTSSIDLPQLYLELIDEVNRARSFTLFADVQMEAGVAEVHLNQIQALFAKAVTPEDFSLIHDEAINHRNEDFRKN